VVRLNNGKRRVGPCDEIGHSRTSGHSRSARGSALGELNGGWKDRLAVATGTAVESAHRRRQRLLSTPVPYALGAIEPVAQIVDLDTTASLDVDHDSPRDNNRSSQVFRNTGAGVFAPTQLVTWRRSSPRSRVIGEFKGRPSDFARVQGSTCSRSFPQMATAGIFGTDRLQPRGGAGPSPECRRSDWRRNTDLIVQGDGSETSGF
jgi:hypothetical protein